MRGRAAVAAFLFAGAGLSQTVELPEVVLPLDRQDLEAAVAELIDREVAAVRLDPGSADLRGRLGLAYEANLLWPEAERCFAQAAAMAPENELWRLHWAVALETAGRPAEALEVLEAMSDRAVLPATLQRLGYLRLEFGDLEGAARAFARLIETKPGSAAGYLGAGEVLLQQGEIDWAVERLESALAVDGTAMSAHYQLGVAYRRQGRLEEAKRALALGSGAERRWLDDPLSGEVSRRRVFLTARIDLAGAYLAARRPEDAATVLEELLARHPSNVTVLNNLAIAYLRLGRLDEGKALLERALTIDQEHFTTYINLSSWAQRSGKNDEALSWAHEAARRAPGVAATHQAVARTLLLRQADGSSPPRERQEEARKSLERAVEAGADHPGVYLQLARLSVVLEDRTRAYELLNLALERWPDFWPAELQRVWLLAEDGRWEEAHTVLQRVKEAAPEHPDVTRLEERIATQGPPEEQR